MPIGTEPLILLAHRRYPGPPDSYSSNQEYDEAVEDYHTDLAEWESEHCYDHNGDHNGDFW